LLTFCLPDRRFSSQKVKIQIANAHRCRCKSLCALHHHVF
jgi:hypothetical protein